MYSEALDASITVIGDTRLSPDLEPGRGGAWVFGVGPVPEVRGLPGWPYSGFSGNMEAAAVASV